MNISKSMYKIYNPREFEDAVYNAWEQGGYFRPETVKQIKGTKSFSIAMPPANATGTLHIGHAMGLALQDLMIRYHRMKGERALWLPGTDHAAIATQNKVEKDLYKAEKKTRHDLGREEFLKRVEAFVESSKATIRSQVRKMGSSADWSRERFTLDPGITEAVRTIFVAMYQDGLIYRGDRIVNWCPRCHSTLSDDEVEYKEEKAPFYYLRYGPVVIGTARPETKFLDKTIVVHPKDPRYRDLVGKEFDIDWISDKVHANVIADASIDREFGTGAMTMTPAHSFEDFALAQRHHLPVIQIINEEGKFTEAAGEFAGKDARGSRDEIVARLKERGLLERVDDQYIHNLSVCYRCGTPIEPLVSRQWFIAVDRPVALGGRARGSVTGARRGLLKTAGKTLKEIATEVVKDGTITILPKRFEKVYFHWMKNLHDWTISRQIWFGHRIPAWYCLTCTHGRGKEVGLEYQPIVAVHAPTTCPTCGDTNLIQDPDTLDTWFSSALWTFATLGWPEKTRDLVEFHPTSVLETAYDILFFWVARMILMTTYALSDIPFETVYLHGLVRDKEGRKMSKSLGNGIDPLDMIRDYGADAVRLSLVLGMAAGSDSRLYPEKIEGYRNFVNKLWNVGRFIKSSELAARGSGFKRHGVEHRTPNSERKNLSLADQWILDETNELVAKTTADIEAFRFGTAGDRLYEFTWHTLADWYVEIAKYQMKSSELAARGSEEVLYSVFRTLLKLCHPFIPFVTEVLWKELYPEAGMLIISDWPRPAGRAKRDTQVTHGIKLLKAIVTSIRILRATYRIDPAKAIPVTLTSPRHAKFLNDFAPLIGHLTHAEIHHGAPLRGSIVARIVSVTIGIEIAPAIDVVKERARIAHEIEIQKALVDRYQRQLAGEFRTRAPREVVTEAEEKQKTAEATLTELHRQAEQLKE
ncbi:MAG: valine--tRNA ligase [Parcubacteria group bacterium]|nr:valine--tRNA ligase [Parcubacteria group bacterium]